MAKDIQEDGSPQGPWGKTWVVACLLIALMLGGLELLWRMRGHRPSIASTEQLWCYHRERLEGAGRDTLALVGASRLQIDFALEEFGRSHSHIDVVQLSVPAKSAYATLRDLAGDESFRGTVLCEMEELSLQPIHHADQQPYVDYYRQKWGPGKKATLLLSVVPQLMLTQLQPRLGGVNLLIWLREGRLPLVNYTETSFDRQRFADYSLVDTESLIKTRLAYIRKEMRDHPPASPDRWQQVIDEVAGFVRRIEARGGKVAIVVCPLQGRLLALQHELFPRERYWQPFAAGVGTDVIHYEEMPGHEQLHCPDDSHLDPAGGVAFTRWVATELERRGYIVDS